MRVESAATRSAVNHRRSEPAIAERIEWLVDNAAAYHETLDAIERAHKSIWITQLAIDADCAVYAANVDGQVSSAKPRLLFAALLAASARGVAIRIILNETLLLDTVTPLRAALRRAGARDIRVRGIKRFPQLLHAKMVIVDEREAMLLGSPFVNGYWDDSDHQPSDARRPARELGGRPLHDLSAHITGPAVRALGAFFAELWNDVSVGEADDAPIERRVVRAPESGGSIGIARTTPDGASPRSAHGRTEVLAAVETALASAQRLIYIEHQYLSSRRVIAALVAALQRASELEVIIVLNQNPDVTAYRGWQNTRFAEAKLLDHPRVGIFALWRATPSSTPGRDWTINQLFVHSKVLIVDDAWVTIGSANLDGVSLHSYGDDFTGWLGRRVFHDVRNFDVNAIVRGDVHDIDNPVRALRDQLWAEHLGGPPGGIDESPLARWRARAANGIATLNGAPLPNGRGDATRSVVLPYSVRPTPRRQLRDVGVRAAGRLDLRFNPGWLEVHFSPNWVRNMFA